MDDDPFAILPSDLESPLTTPSKAFIYVKAGTDPYRPRMSLSRLDPAEWIVIDDTTPRQLAEKEHVLSDPNFRSKVIAG